WDGLDRVSGLGAAAATAETSPIEPDSFRIAHLLYFLVPECGSVTSRPEGSSADRCSHKDDGRTPAAGAKLPTADRPPAAGVLLRAHGTACRVAGPISGARPCASRGGNPARCPFPSPATAPSPLFPP